MTYKKIINDVNTLYPNLYTEAEMLMWCSEVNADVMRNIEKNNQPQRTPEPEDSTIIPTPYEDMYRYYILAQIAYFQRDFELYSRHLAMYVTRFEEYCAYWIRTFGSDTASFSNWI